jgi:hypothetical protein
MCTFPLDIIFNYGIFYISIDIVMITYRKTQTCCTICSTLFDRSSSVFCSSSCDFPAIDEQPGENNREYDDYDIDAQAPGYDQEGGNDELDSSRIEQQECRPEDAVRKEEGSSSFDSIGTRWSAVVTGSAQKGGKPAQVIADRQNKLAWQCLRYAVAFYGAWTPITILRIFQAVHKPIPFILLLFASCCTPLQGLPNFLAYLYPRLVK